MFSSCRIAFLALFLLFVLPAHVFAQDGLKIPEFQEELKTMQQELDAFEPTLLDASLNDQSLFETRQRVKQLRLRFLEIRDSVKPFYSNLEAEINDIGPAPAADSDVVEAESIKILRETLTKDIQSVQGVLSQAEALASKSTRFLERLASLRRSQFVGKILENNVSPFNAELWPEAINDGKEALSTLSDNWTSSFPNNPNQKKKFVRFLSFTCLAFLTIFLLAFAINTVNLRRRVKVLEEATLIKRLGISGYAILFTLIAGFAGLAVIFLFIESQGLIDENNQSLSYNMFLVLFFVVFALTKSWMLSCSGAVRKLVTIASTLSVALFCVDYIALETGRHLGVPVELAIAQSFIVTTVFAALVLTFFLALLKQKPSERPFLVKRRFFYLGIMIGVFIMLANALGYVALTRFVFEQAVLLSNFAIAVIVLRAMIRPILVRIEKFFKRNTDKEDNLLLYWLVLLVDSTLFVLSLPIIAAIIGVEWEGIKLLIYQAISGVKVGGITISLSSVATAIVLFIILLSATRFFQKILGEKVLTKTRMAESVRLSIVQIVGYIGLTIALMASISAVGFDLSNLALIAGALSVGIGFGLQSIVSNFVSGLILLFERPIKVGDWVIVSSGEGIVKRINVRATEIETFDRTSIIIPNSELISSSVKNWTHKDRIGRIIITVGVSYDCNPRRVRDLLLEVAKADENILKNPAPSVNFKDFGDSALIFDLRIFIRNVSEMYAIGTEVRLNIWDQLKEEGIEIPFPQRDLHIKSAEGVKGVLNNNK